MKTAMELALARIEMLYGIKDEIHWEMFKNDCMEKEKEQIRLSFFRDGHEYWDNITFEEYYNKTYKK